MKKPYDQHLRAAMEELKPILKKYDCMGTIILASPTHSEFVFEPATSWSVCRWEDLPGGKGLRFRSKREDFKSKEDQHAATTATVHGIESARWLSAKMHDQLGEVIDQLRKHMSILTNVGGIMGDPDSVPGDGK